MSTLAHNLPAPPSTARKMWPFHVGATADVVVGLALVIFASDAAHLTMPDQASILGFAAASVLRVLGVFLILFAIETVATARSEGKVGRFRSWIVAANWGTVALAVIVIALWHAAFSPVGIAAVVMIALAVGVLAFFQRRAI